MNIFRQQEMELAQQELTKEFDERIAALGAERASVGAELGRVQEILAVAVRPATPPAGEPPVAQLASPPSTSARLPRPSSFSTDAL